MKKLLFIFAMATLLSCSKDDPTPAPIKDCGCDKLFLQKTSVVNPNGNTISETTWQPYGIVKESTNIKDCSQNGKIVYTNRQQGAQGVNTLIVDYKHQLECK